MVSQLVCGHLLDARLIIAEVLHALAVAIIVRKLMLSLVTKHSVDTTDGTSSIRISSIQCL